MRNVFPLIVFFILINTLTVSAQRDSLDLVELNQRIDDLVVKQDVKSLEDLYADDFVFSHGSGKVEGKESWLKTVGRAVYPSRQHDSVKVELHPGVAVVKGKMDIRRNDKDKVAIYHLRYIRVYALRGKQWQMISHSTTEEKHDN
ncbi:nuclear transport factor 2 family protein [Terrimonas sp. NA20]|uniref:Nuclear transport factor 2 family protein n=1 Tax=Terrimonas ginsenosidimutans TaxID=2908004 RepID=A0ABS9KX34_9BACT|nr:nuclear transport factor 2 family protein [Terrimonas ginsenosidimutans]MCG2616902.1 nuclear transport factor 2 family protein [Terrimonas ginsenosidimutans]